MPWIAVILLRNELSDHFRTCPHNLQRSLRFQWFAFQPHSQRTKSNLCSLKGQLHRTPTIPQGYPVRENHPRSSKAWRSPLEENVNSLLRPAPGQEQLSVNSCMYFMEWKQTQCCWWLQTVGHYNTWPSPSGFRRKYNRKIGITDHKFTLVISN